MFDKTKGFFKVNLKLERSDRLGIPIANLRTKEKKQIWMMQVIWRRFVVFLADVVRLEYEKDHRRQLRAPCEGFLFSPVAVKIRKYYIKIRLCVVRCKDNILKNSTYTGVHIFVFFVLFVNFLTC